MSRFEDVEVVLAGLALQMGRLTGQVLAGWMDRLTASLEQTRDGILSKPGHLGFGHEGAQLLCDRKVASGVAESDGR